MPKQPYADQPDRAYWRRAVAAQHVTRMTDLFDGVPDLGDLKIATGGSCFAQHIGRALKERGMRYVDYETAPSFLTPSQSDQFGYGVYSCRYGNIYTVRQLKQLFDEAFGQREPVDAIWRKAGRFHDALRPGVEPNGFGSREEVVALRAAHLARVRAMFTDLDMFVFTLGLTEAWVSNKDETTYPIAPGVMAGEFDPAAYRFENFRYPSVYADMASFLESLRRVNPSAKLLLTVSPVPLAATATQNHVLVATTYSKSVLRSVAGDLAADFPAVYYFPSYEVITGQPTRHMYYDPDLRTVAQAGVNEVMRHFFAGEVTRAAPPAIAKAAPILAGYEHCEESLLDPSAS